MKLLTRHTLHRLIPCLCLGLLPALALADATAEAVADQAVADSSKAWGVYGQITNVTQWHPAFNAPYSGGNSMDPRARNAETTDLTLYAGFRPWQGAEVWINPEYDQGFGLSNTLGVAGFPSGEAYKVGANTPYLRLPRLFLRQTINLGGGEEKIDAAANQLAGRRASDNVIITLGKFSVVDVFDNNAYAHDPRGDFFNWSVVDGGAFDYAADSWGFTLGGAVEWSHDWWTLRGGLFALSTEPNGKKIDTRFKQHSFVTEFEVRHNWFSRPGKIKLLAFNNRGNMASYRDAVAQAGQNVGTPDVAAVRHMQNRAGMVLNLEQEWSPSLGFFARASANDGGKEAFEFTEINRSVSLGLALKGDSWGRHDDTFGLAAVVNHLSGSARDYFAAGGMGILIGDGRLNYAPEKIAEIYYGLRAAKQLTLTLDYQHVVNPGYNHDRGPIPLVGLRLHGEF